MTSSALSAKADPAEHAVRFFNALPHTGDYHGQPFQLRPWQEQSVRAVFGPRNADNTRRIRKVFQALPRKQGKTELVAAAALYCLTGEGHGKTHQRVYTAAGDVEQASLIF